MHEQPRVTEFIPVRYLTVGLLGGATAGAIAILGVAHFYLPQLTEAMPAITASTFDMSAAGSLATWLTSTLLALAAAASLMVYAIRRHRADDYHGRYRVWLWLAICVAIMSVSATANLHGLLQQFLVQVTGRTVIGDGAVYWIAAWSLVLLTVGGRLVLDCRRCRAATTFFALTVVVWTLGVCEAMHILPLDERYASLFGGLCKLSGHLGLLLGATLSARYALLEAQGRLVVRVRKEKKAKAPKADKAEKTDKAEKPARKTTAVKIDPAHKDAAGKRTDLDAPHITPKATIRAEVTEDEDEDDRPSASNYGGDDGEEEDAGQRKSTRADRKRMRREKQQREASH